jgi:PAS domain S-box-containing protein
MKQSADWIEKRHSLRSSAEGMLAGLSSPDAGARPTEVLVHELLVHKVELEMQIDELQRLSLALDGARKQYADLYEHAPFGYIALDHEGLIRQINLCGATLLGAKREHLIGTPFSTFVTSDSQALWHRRFSDAVKNVEAEIETGFVPLTRADGVQLTALLGAQSAAIRGEAPLLRMTLLGVEILELAATQARLAQCTSETDRAASGHHPPE